MPEKWFVRVQGAEYGPVDLETLREWKTEGRLIASNPVRRGNEEAWILAGTVTELFPPAPIQPAAPPSVIRPRSFGEISRETFRIYRKGFAQFLALAFLVAIPSFVFKLSLAFIQFQPGEPWTQTARLAGAIAIVAVAALIAIWPIFLGGIQFTTDEVANGRRARLGDILRRATNHWPRMAQLCCLVYGAFLFWTTLPLLAVASFASAPNVISGVITLLALVLQIYMTARLFINFMFWQQSATLGKLDALEALRESRELARSRTHLPRLQRPLYRGAILASIWLIVLLIFSAAVELPFLVLRLRGVTTTDQALEILRALSNAPAPDALTIITYVLSSLVHAVLRPLLGIAFVVLYFDAKAKT